MGQTVLPRAQPEAFDNLLRAQAHALHANREPPRTLDAWRQRREALRRDMARAMGPTPAEPCPLEPRTLGTLRRQGYRIEKVVFQSRPDLWVTSNLYVPDPCPDRRPAVLVVHGHWRGARRDPVVQARCLGLVQLGFVVLAVDAFGAGERHSDPAPGRYHGALYGSTLWPNGHTLLGMQVYDNRRAVDYLATRPEVDIRKVGVTGASGGGNQSMYAGAMDDRIGAVVPVCSVGTYQSYLRAACCVCEVLPGALRFTEEGDVLGLVAPRALLVINATRDSFNFSVEQARISMARAQAIFRLHYAADKIRHQPFESGHDYSQPMREAMYGWMTRWLKEEGRGDPIPEPRHQVESAEDLACFPDGRRPAPFLLLPQFAGRAGQTLVERHNAARPGHVEEWESTAMDRRGQLRRVLGEPTYPPRPMANAGRALVEEMVATAPVTLQPEPNLPLPALLRERTNRGEGPHRACVLLHLEGKAQALRHPLAAALVADGWSVVAPDLRATGETRPERDAIAGAPDHNSAEHAVWMGRPLLGQWVADVAGLVDWLRARRDVDGRRVSVVGLGHAGIVALCAGALLDDRVHSAAAVGAMATYVTSEPYPPGTPMGLLAPGILTVADVPHLAALCAPRRVLIAGATTPQGQALDERALAERFASARAVYAVHRREEALALRAALDVRQAVRGL